jgi:hypothetical protein
VARTKNGLPLTDLPRSGRSLKIPPKALKKKVYSKALPKGPRDGVSNIFPHFIPAADYPSRSPELNAMEHSGAGCRREWKLARLASRRELERYLVKLWNDVPQQVVRNCIAAISERLLPLIVAAKGSQILAK